MESPCAAPIPLLLVRVEFGVVCRMDVSLLGGCYHFLVGESTGLRGGRGPPRTGV